MEYKKKENSYADYNKYSASVLKTQNIEGGGSVQGYAAAKKEENDHLVPVETMRMVNTDGVFSVGVNRNRETTIAITSDMMCPLLREDRNLVHMDSARLVREVSDQVYTNSHDPKVSGIVYKEDIIKSPGFMVNSLKSALESKDNAVVQAVTPFLSGNQDKEEKKKLEEYLRSKLEQGDTEEYRLLKEEYDRQNIIASRKEAEEHRLIHNLTAAVEKMKEEAGHLENAYRRMNILSPENPEAEQDENGGKDNIQDDDSRRDINQEYPDREDEGRKDEDGEDEDGEDEDREDESREDEDREDEDREDEDREDEGWEDEDREDEDREGEDREDEDREE